MTLSQSELIYQVKNVTKVFESNKGDIIALDSISFNIKRGELIVIVGPSGCGKSTLLRVLASLIKPTSGEILFKNEAQVSSQKEKFGFVFQEPTLMPWRNVISNIMLPLEVETKGKNKEEIHEQALQLIKLLNLTGFEKNYPTELSGGMNQRVGIARALITNPPLLLMDEPFSALDEMLRQKLNFELLNLKKLDRTIVFVTHNIQEAVILADRVIIMGLKPNTIIGETTVDLPERTPALLTSPEFFENIVKIRKIIAERNEEIN